MEFKKKFKKALVTKGAGFVGSHIVEDLLAERLKVISIDECSAGKKVNLAPLKSPPRVFHINGFLSSLFLPCS